MTDLAPTVDALSALTTALTATRLTLNLDGVAAFRASTVELRDQITDYLLPRLSKLDAPLVAVIGGSTGSGKSTITNSLVGAEVSPAGVLRPTTRAPVLICNPIDEAWFAGPEVLPELRGHRIDPGYGRGPSDSAHGYVRGRTRAPSTPQTSIRSKRPTATSQPSSWRRPTCGSSPPRRSATPMPSPGTSSEAKDRGTALAIIINRVPAGAAGEIVPHLESMLINAGLPDIPLFAIEESPLIDKRLAPDKVAELKSILTDVANNADRRAEIVRQDTRRGARQVPDRARRTADAATQQDLAVEELRSTLEGNYTRARETLSHNLQGGALLRTEVLDRWQELIGTAELMRAVQSRISRIRDRIGSFIRGREADTTTVQGEITSTLEQLLIDQADAVALDVVTAWRQLPGGKQVLGDDRSLETASAQLRSTIGAEIRAWQDDILGLVSELGAGKRTTARILALGINSIGVALMIVLFSQTGGITGGEVAVAGGTAAVSQALLNAVFGEQAVRDLAAQARTLLLDRVGGLLEIDANRFRTKLWSSVDPVGSTGQLRLAIAQFEAAQAHEVR
ncbi:MAG: hypothetical protein R2706_14950 [Acidimicrobiales bacterium]